jgi:hypothetical protein
MAGRQEFRPSSGSEKFANSVLGRDLTIFFRRNRILTEGLMQEIVKRATVIHKSTIGNRPAERAFDTFREIAEGIDSAAVRAVGLDGTATVSDMLIRTLAVVAVNDLDLTPESIQHMNRFLDDLEGQKHHPLAWQYRGAIVFKEHAHNKLETLFHANWLELDNAGSEIDALRAAVPDINAATRQLMENMARLRRYGIKSCFWRDGVTHSKDDAWIFLDPRDYPLSETYLGGTPLLQVYLAARKWIKNLKVEEAVETIGDYRTSCINLGFRRYTYWNMDPNGEFQLGDTPFGMAPVRNLYASAGKETEYEVMRFLHMLRLFDLLVPISVSSTLEHLPTVFRARKDGGAEKKKIKAPQISRLIMPRLFLIRSEESIQGLEEGLRSEEEEDRQITAERASVRDHPIIDHIRRLPEGHHATPSALAKAKGAGFPPLGKNETYVQRHVPEGETPLPTEAIERK